MRAAKQTDLFKSGEDVLAPLLAVVVAALLGVAVFHFNPSLGTGSAAEVTHSPSHIAHGLTSGRSWHANRMSEGKHRQQTFACAPSLTIADGSLKNC